MFCQECETKMKKFGKNRNGSQRFRCNGCKATCTDEVTSVDNRRVPAGKMVMAIRMLLEGNSVRSVERLTGINRDTIIYNMVAAGEHCKRFLANVIRGVRVDDVQSDEIWGFVGCKEKTRIRNNYSAFFGDAYCFTAIERTSKLLVAWHLGKREPADAYIFSDKLRYATAGKFQLTTDGWPAYPGAIRATFGESLDYAQLAKVYRHDENDRRYSPPQVIDVIVNVRTGNPDQNRICTSHIERHNLSIRMAVRRMTRLTNGHSRKWENHEAALALFFAYYNFCRVHSTIRKTPAVAAGLASETWSVEQLLATASQSMLQSA